MHKEGDEIHVTEEEATGAKGHQHLRYILGISLFLVVIAMSIIWIIPALQT